MELSVIIPAYNCCTTVLRILTILATKSDHIALEAFVIDDLSTDGLESKIQPFLQMPWLVYHRNTVNLGPGGTRNVGLDRAKGKIIMFLDGDNVPSEHCFEEHLNFHLDHPELDIGVLGKLSYPIDMVISPLMKLDNSDQDHHDQYQEGTCVHWYHFSTANISLKRQFVDIRFCNEKFNRRIGFEDTEFGLRLHHKGLKLMVNPKATSYHYHFRTPEQYLKKVQKYGDTFRIWLNSGDPLLLKETDFIRQYLPQYELSQECSLMSLKMFFQKLLVNDFSAPWIKALAKFLEGINQNFSVHLYRRLYRYQFNKGFGKK